MSKTRWTRAIQMCLLSTLGLGCSDQGLKIQESPPKATLLSPGENDTFLEGTPINFRAQLDDNDDGVGSLEVAWRSDSLGTLRGESNLNDVGVEEFVTDELSAGPHLITVTATDPDGNTSSDDVSLSIVPNTAPNIGFAAPTDNAPFGTDEDILVLLVVDDSEEEPQALTLTWTLNGIPHADGADKADEYGEAIAVFNGLDLGTYNLKVRVSDSLGESAEATVSFRVIPIDGDGDGVGTAELGGEDCDDQNPDIGPGADELCDGVDNDCDGLIDAEDDDIVDAIIGHPDLDDDGYGDDSTSVLSCDLSDLSDVGGDCNDLDPSIHPGAMEVCGDGLDNNCDGGSGSCKWAGENLISTADHISFGADSNDGIAQSIAGGDLNGDGQSDLIIGATDVDTEYGDAGAVYIINGPLIATVGIAQAQADYVISGIMEDSAFGQAIAVTDLNDDGSHDLIVGAPGTTISGTGPNAGRTYIFFDGVTGDTTADDADVTISASHSHVRFGETIATDGDLDGDGLNDLLISSVEDDTYASDAGSVAVFMGGSILSTGDISIDDRDTLIGATDASMMLGFALKFVGDVNGDGRDDILVGAPEARPHGTKSGAAYLFLGNATSFSTGSSRFHTAADATYNGTSAYDYAGSAITTLGDIDADGYAEFAISAPFNGDFLDEAGAVYLMVDPPRTGVHDIPDVADTVIRGSHSSDRVGSSLAGGIDLDNDGVPDLIIGAPRARTEDTGKGNAFLIYGPLNSLGDGEIGGDEGIEDGAFAGESIRGGAGETLLGGHDWSGDGLSDLAVTSPATNSPEGVSSAGGLFVFFGRGM